MKFEILKSGQILCTMTRQEMAQRGPGENDTPAVAEEKYKRLVDEVVEEAEDRFGEDMFNDDGRVCINTTERSIYIAIMTDPKKLKGKHLSEISLAIAEREKSYWKEEAFPAEDVLSDMDIEEFYDEMPDPITELIMTACYFDKVTQLMSFLRSNRHLANDPLTYAYKDMDGRYIFAIKGINKDMMELAELKASECGARPIKHVPSVEYMNEHYKRINITALVAIK